MGIDYLVRPTENRALAYSTCIGACFAIVALMKLSMDCLIAGVVFGVLYTMVKGSQWGLILKSALAMILGMAIGSAPAIIYFAIHHSLGEMIYATFTYNFLYIDNWIEIGPRNYVVNGARMMVCVILPLATFFYCRRHKVELMPIMTALSIMPILVYLKGPMYLYYFVAITPLVYLCFIMLSQRRWWVKALAMLALVGAPTAVADWHAQSRLVHLYNINNDKTGPKASELYSMGLKVIPEQELDSVYLLEVTGYYTDLLLQLGHNPVGKYFTHQYFTSRVDPHVHHDIISSFGKSRPLWVISGAHMEQTMLGDEYAPSYQMVDSLVVDLQDGSGGTWLYILRRNH